MSALENAWCKLNFQVRAHTRRGETVVVCGDVPSMGSFAPSQAVTLHTDPDIYPLWKTTQPVVVPFGIRIQYKYAIFSGGTIRQWEPISGDRILSSTQPFLKLHDVWGQAGSAQADGVPAGNVGSESVASGDSRATHTVATDSSGAPNPGQTTPVLDSRALPSVLMGPRFTLGQQPHVIGAGGGHQDSPMLRAAMERQSQGVIAVEHDMLPASASMSVSISPLAHTAGGASPHAAGTQPAHATVSPPSVPVQVGLPSSYDTSSMPVTAASSAPPFRANSAPELEGGGAQGGEATAPAGGYLSATPAAKRLHSSPTHGAVQGGAAPGAVPRLPDIRVGHAATAGRLARLLGQKRVIVISYHLPVILRRSADGTWAATWDVDNFLARSKHSVASELQVIWVGCVTRRCVDAVTATEGTREQRSSDVARFSDGDVEAAVAAMDAAGASAATLAAATRAHGGDGSAAADGGMATITTASAAEGGSRSAGHRYSFTTPDTSGEGLPGPSVTLQVPSAGIGSSPLGPLDGGGAGHSKNSAPAHSALGAMAQSSPPAAPSAHGASQPAALPLPPTPPSAAQAQSVSDEDILELSAADRDAIRAALRPMNVVPVFLGHDNVVLADATATDAAAAAAAPGAAAGASGTGVPATGQADGAYWYGRPDEPGAYRQLVPTHAFSATAAEAAAAPVEVASGLTRHMVRDFGLYCSSVLRAAMNNVLDLGDANSIFAQSAEAYAAPSAEAQAADAAAAEDADVPHAKPASSCGVDESITSRTYRLRSQGWKSYSRVNEYIARVAAAAMQPGDIVWTHDYHLCMVPHFLTRLVTPAPPQVFYMHASWPTSEVFRSLAEREQLLNGMLQADVIGFHTFNHARHFLQCCKRILGLNYASRGGRLGLDCRGRDVMVDITHMGVDVPVLNEWMASEEAAAFARALRTKYPNRVIIGGFDVCQRLSGVALKLLAYERLMEENPRYHSRVVLVQRCEMRDAPDLDAAKTSAEIQQLVARIRGRFGAVIDYAEAVAFPPTYRIGLFHCSDVLLHTPLREGLNLVPLQYVYVRTRWELQRGHAEESSPGPSGSAARGGAHTPHSAGAPASAVPPSPQRPGEQQPRPADAKPPTGTKEPNKPPPRPSAKRGLFSMLGSLFSSHGSRGTPTIPEVEEGEPASPSDARAAHGDSSAPAGHGTSAFAGATGLAGIRLGTGYRRSPASRGGERGGVTGGVPLSGGSDGGHSLGEDAGSVGGGSLASGSPALSGIAGGDLRRIESQAELAVPVNSEPLVAPLPPPPRGGCVVLSEASTASHILNSHIVVNPWAVSDTATALDKGLWMDDKERAVRQMRDYLYATRNPSYRWARQILTDVVESRMTFGHGQFVEMEASELTTVTRRTTLGGARASSEAATGPSAALQHDVSSVGGSPVVSGLPAPPGVDDAGAGAALPSAADRVNSLRQLSLDSISSMHRGTSFNAELLLLERREVLSAFVRAKRRVLFVDYGGTLIEREGMGTYVKHEFIGSARRRKLPGGVVSAIGALSADPATELWVVTGLSADVIGNTQLASLPHLNIAAENGAVVSHGTGEAGAARSWNQDPTVLGGGLDAKAEWDSVKDVAERIMREYQWRVTGAVIRSAATSVVFDYRNADPEWAQAQTKYLTGDLARRLVSPLVKVHQRKSRVEVSLRGATRGQLVRHGLSLAPDADFVAAIGDDASDEEMFSGVMEAFAGGGAGGVGRDLQSVFTITVGRKRTGARYFLPDVAHVQLLLTGLSQVSAVLPALPSGDEEGGFAAAEPPVTTEPAIVMPARGQGTLAGAE